MAEIKKRSKVKIRQSGLDHNGQLKIEISGLNEEESECVNGVFCGHWWTTVQDERIVFEPTHKPLPAPTEDIDIAPYWQENDQLQLKLFHLDEKCRDAALSPSITIGNLCGYYLTKEGYKEEADKLESFGFHCLRSRRDDSGQYWEIWYLPNLWSIKGALKEAVDNIKDNRNKLDRTISFLCQNCSFGILNVTVQRAAMVLDDL